MKNSHLGVSFKKKEILALKVSIICVCLFNNLFIIVEYGGLTLALVNLYLSFFENSVDPDQLASDEAI